MDLPITFQESIIHPFTFVSGDPEDLQDDIAASLAAIVNGDDILLGKIGGTQPTTGIIWLRDGSWWYFDGGQYVPVKVKVGTATNQVTLIANPTAPRNQLLQDKDGTIALTSDIYDRRATIVVPASNIIDWSQSESFYRQLNAASTTFTMTNSLPGQKITLTVYSPSSSQAIILPASINWVGGGTMGAQTSPGIDKYNLENVAGQVYAEHKTDYA